MFGDTLGLAAALNVGDTRAALMERWPIATCERVMCEISATFTWAIINNFA